MKIDTPLGPPHLAVRAPSVCFLYLAQAHQVLHSLSVAVRLAQTRPDVQVDIAATSQAVLDQARAMAAAMGDAPLGWRLLGPAWLRGGGGTPAKLPMLAANAAALARYDVIVAPERTTAALRWLGVRAKLVYTQHGAGDRAGPFEPRLRRFDLVFAAGPKQRDRMVDEGLVRPDRCAVVGYPKFDLVDALHRSPPSLLAGAAGLVAGAMSMAAGEYVSVSSQSDTEKADLARERAELSNDPAAEVAELTGIYAARGVEPGLAKQVAEQLMAKDALAAHAHDELGLSQMSAARPIQAAFTSAATFTLGAALPLAIVLVAPRSWVSAAVAMAGLACLAILGAIGARAGGASVFKSVVRVTFWGAFAMALTAVIGKLFGAVV